MPAIGVWFNVMVTPPVTVNFKYTLAGLLLLGYEVNPSEIYDTFGVAIWLARENTVAPGAGVPATKNHPDILNPVPTAGTQGRINWGKITYCCWVSSKQAVPKRGVKLYVGSEAVIFGVGRASVAPPRWPFNCQL